MANIFIKPTVIVDTAIHLLLREIVLPQLIWLNGIGDFAGKYQDTITIRVPARTQGQTRALRGTGSARNLTTQTLTENAIPVTLTEDVYNAVELTDEELTLDIHDFSTQVLNRQIRAVAETLESGIATMMTTAPYSENNMVVQCTESTMWPATVDARRKLNDKYVPREGRVLVVGSAVESAFLKDQTFQRFDSTGQVSSALRDATIGRVGGLDVVMSEALPHADAYLFHQTAFIMATRPPAAPRGAPFTAAASAAGLAVRWLMDYDYQNTSDRSLVDTFVGFKAVEDPIDGFSRAVNLHLTATGVTVSGNANVTAAAGPAHTSQLAGVTNWGDDRTLDPGTVWTSSAPAKATVSSGGLVTGVAAGTTNITAAYDGVTSANFVVTVT